MRRHWVSISTLVVGIVLGFLVGHYGCKKSAEPIATKQVAMPAPAVVATPTPPIKVATPSCVDSTYTVKKGDSLWRIAKQEYKDGSLYTIIAKASGVKNADLIHPDQELVIPCYDPNDNKVVSVDKPVSPSRARRINKTNLRVTKATPSGETKSQNTTVVVVMAEETKTTTTPTQPVTPVAEPAKIAQEVVTPQTVQVLEEKASAGENGQVQVASATVAPDVQFSPGPIATADLSLLRPGSAWNSLGTNPVEDGNWVNQFHFDQGIVLAKTGGVLVEPYVAVNATVDSEGYSWNNKTKVEAGLRLVKPLSHGVMNVSLAYAHERREEEVGSRSDLTLYHDAWFGWSQPSVNKKGDSSMTLPGTIWWVVGNVSPFEKNNIIGLARAEQGVTVGKIDKVSLIPIGWAQAGFDSQDKPWNNRYTLGGGLKVSFPWRTGVLGIQGGYECTRYHGKVVVSSSATCGPAVRMDVWTGWRNIGRR